jgi:hypothetical protein
VTNPAAVIKSIGLPADANAVMVFASPSGQFYYDVTDLAHLSGLRHLDSFIVTPNPRPPIGTLQKRMPTRRRRQQTIPPAVICKVLRTTMTANAQARVW